MRIKNNYGFTIVELLVVIVVIGILAAITIVSYSGVKQKAISSSEQSDLNGNSNLLKMYQVEHEVLPTHLDNNNCPDAPVSDTKYCLKASSGSYLTYAKGSGQTYIMSISNGTIAYSITGTSSPTSGDDLWVTLGTQTWSSKNLNVGTMISSTTAQTNNSVLEKYCYNNAESNCDIYGGLYQWNEAMQYATASGSQGICPAGSHLPSDTEWKMLEKYLGMSQAEADTVGWRGTHQEGTKLKNGGSSGLNLLLAGYYTGTVFTDIATNGAFWTSSGPADAWYRAVNTGLDTVSYNAVAKTSGASIRCVKD